MMTFLEKQVEYIQTLAKVLSDVFEVEIDVEFIHSDVFSAAVVICEEERIITKMKQKLFNWQLENTSRWDEKLVHITDQEGKCLLNSTVQNRQTMTSQL